MSNKFTAIQADRIKDQYPAMKELGYLPYTCEKCQGGGFVGIEAAHIICKTCQSYGFYWQDSSALIALKESIVKQ